MAGRVWHAATAARLLGVLAWATVLVFPAIVVVDNGGLGGSVASDVLNVVVCVLFVCLVGRLVLTAFARPQRRAASLALALGIALWMAGSAVLSAQGQPDTVKFPAPGEWLFLAAYAGFAAYLVLDGGSSRLSMSTGLDALITCGGAGCLAGFAEVSPVARDFGRPDLALFVGLLYPTLDTSLLLLLIGQVALGIRRVGWRTAQTLLALAVLAWADTTFAVQQTSDFYDYGLVLDLAWAGALLLLVDAACRDVPSRRESAPSPRSDAAGCLPDRTGGSIASRLAGVDWGTTALVSAAGVALVTLTTQPASAVRPFVVIPAVATLVAAGLRLTIALRQARDAAEARRLSQTDDLTGLPNRRALETWLAEGLREGRPLGLLLLDLDGFKEINDALGHEAGDAMLLLAATRLSALLEAQADSRARVVRLGGDEFAVLLLGEDDEARLLDVAQQMRAAVGTPAQIDGIELTVGASVGATLCDADVTTGGDLLRRVDVAMYQAKKLRTGVQRYDQARDEFSRERLQVAEELRYGIDRGELVVWYQPQVDAVSKQPRSVEALVRWSHSTRGLLPPGAFLPAARRAGLMGALTDAVLAQVVEDAAGWHAEGLDVKISVNVAPAELLAPVTVDRLLARIESSSLMPGSLVIEVTEDSFLAEPERAREVIERLRAHGLEVSIDDYGTGYSSLSYLRDLPVQELKIDRAFVSHLLTDPRSEMIVRTTNQLAHGLGLRTVAEGVEDAGTAEALCDIGIDLLQGYHFSRPMPVAGITEWLLRRQAPQGAGI